MNNVSPFNNSTINEKILEMADNILLAKVPFDEEKNSRKTSK